MHLRPAGHLRLVGKRRLDAENDKSRKQTGYSKTNEPVHGITLRVPKNQRSRGQYDNRHHLSAPWNWDRLSALDSQQHARSFATIAHNDAGVGCTLMTLIDTRIYERKENSAG